MTRFFARVIRAFQKHERKSPPEPDPGRIPREKKTTSGMNSDPEPPERELPAQLGAGFYTAGIDIPPGDLLLRPVEGQGELRSGDLSFRLGMSEPDFYSREPKSITLSPGESIEIYGTLLLEPDIASDIVLSPRDYRRDEAIVLGAGRYLSGVDFKPGTYRIEAMYGHGFIDFSHAGGPSDCYLGVDDEKRLWYIPRIDNVCFREDGYLDVSDSLSVSLIPDGSASSDFTEEMLKDVFDEEMERSLA